MRFDTETTGKYFYIVELNNLSLRLIYKFFLFLPRIARCSPLVWWGFGSAGDLSDKYHFSILEIKSLSMWKLGHLPKKGKGKIKPVSKTVLCLCFELRSTFCKRWVMKCWVSKESVSPKKYYLWSSSLHDANTWFYT